MGRLAFIATLVLARGAAEYSLGVRDSLMIAHSFKGSEFGPAQRLHGATYTCDVAFCARKLRPGLNWVLDIGQASEIVAAVLKEYHLHNLDELFPEENTTTEWMCEEGVGTPGRARPAFVSAAAVQVLTNLEGHCGGYASRNRRAQPTRHSAREPQGEGVLRAISARLVIPVTSPTGTGVTARGSAQVARLLNAPGDAGGSSGAAPPARVHARTLVPSALDGGGSGRGGAR